MTCLMTLQTMEGIWKLLCEQPPLHGTSSTVGCRAMSKNGSCKQQVDTRKEKTGHTSRGQVQKTGIKERSSKNALSHTTLVGLDCGEFLVLATDGRTTEPNGLVVVNNFVKHVKINDLVHLIYAGDNDEVRDYVERLQGLLKGTTNNDVDQVAVVAERLLRQIWLDKHNSKISEMTDGDKVDEGNKTPEPECLMHVILGGHSSRSSTGFSLYTIDEVEGFCTLRRVKMAFGGSGGEYAKAYALAQGILDTTTKGITAENDGPVFTDEIVAESFAMRAIAAAVVTDWSGGNINILVIGKRGLKGGKLGVLQEGKNVCLKKVVFAQENPKICTTPYRLFNKGTFIPKCFKVRVCLKGLID